MCIYPNAQQVHQVTLKLGEPFIVQGIPQGTWATHGPVVELLSSTESNSLPKKPWVPHPWRHSETDWIGPWAT